MRIHFFTAPFYFAFIWFRVQGSRFRALVAASPQIYMGQCPKAVFKGPLIPSDQSPVTSH